jgi:hypothetical protein
MKKSTIITIGLVVVGSIVLLALLGYEGFKSLATQDVDAITS